jgi:hypothetical protein
MGVFRKSPGTRKLPADARCVALCCAGMLALAGCQSCPGPAYDRPFPFGQVTDAHWETQETNAEASDFIFYDHEFVGDTAVLTPAAEKHLQQVALRLPHVPFPVVVEEIGNSSSPNLGKLNDTENPRSDAERRRAIDVERRRAIIERLVMLTQVDPRRIAGRVVVASAIAEGISSVEGEAAYYTTLSSGATGAGAGAGAGTGTGIGARTFSTFGGAFQ